MKSQHYGPLWRGLVLGLASAAGGLAIAQLVTGLFGGGLSPINAVGQEFIDIVPKWLKQLAIDWFGTNDKLVLQLSIAAVLAILSLVIGVLAQRNRMKWAYGLTVLIGLVGVAALLARPNSGVISILATLIGTAVSCVILQRVAPSTRTAVAVGGASGATEAHVPGDVSTTDSLVDRDKDGDGSVPEPVIAGGRREFLQNIGVVALGSVVFGGLGSWLGRRGLVNDERADIVLGEVSSGTAPGGTLVAPDEFLIPDAANVANGAALPQPATVLGEVAGPTEFGLGGVTPFVVPTGDFYKIDTALSTPQVSIDDWELRIHGMVDNELRLSYQDLLDRPQIERDITLACVSNKVGGRYVGNAKWQGVRLADVLAEAGIQPGATQVASRSVDGWSCGSPTAQIMDGRDALIAIGMNGEPLPPDHGYPARLVVPGLYGYVSATKWVSEIELTRWEDFDGYWMPRGWAKLGPIKTMARIERPDAARQADANADGAVDIAGTAWATHRGISKVEVQIDDDGQWRECELAGVPSDDTWRHWKYTWADPTEGDHNVVARAYDGNGVLQPEGPKAEDPDGAEGYHRINFRV